jgi:hypothetical protein
VFFSWAGIFSSATSPVSLLSLKPSRFSPCLHSSILPNHRVRLGRQRSTRTRINEFAVSNKARNLPKPAMSPLAEVVPNNQILGEHNKCSDRRKE